MRLVFLGAPGSGKGTQSKLISKRVGIKHLSTGDLLRAAIKDGTEVGKLAKEYIDAGSLVPDQVIVGVIKDRTKADDCQNGFVLDGFPRTIAQADALSEMLEESGMKLDAVVYLEINQEKLIKRLTGRRVCSSCGAEYHLEFKPPTADGICDLDGANLDHRSDDHEDKIKNRLNTYNSETSPLIDYYQEKSLLKTVQAEGEISAITQNIVDVLEIR